MELELGLAADTRVGGALCIVSHAAVDVADDMEYSTGPGAGLVRLNKQNHLVARVVGLVRQPWQMVDVPHFIDVVVLSDRHRHGSVGLRGWSLGKFGVGGVIGD